MSMHDEMQARSKYEGEGSKDAIMPGNPNGGDHDVEYKGPVLTIMQRCRALLFRAKFESRKALLEWEMQDQ